MGSKESPTPGLPTPDFGEDSESKASSTWAPKVCKIMAFMAIIMGLGLLFYILLGFRQYLFHPINPKPSTPD